MAETREFIDDTIEDIRNADTGAKVRLACKLNNLAAQYRNNNEDNEFEIVCMLMAILRA